MLLLLAKFIRDGRNWSRWIYSIASVFPLGDVFKVTGFFTTGHLAFKLSYGLTGLAAIVSIALLFARPSAPHFRPAGSERVSPFSAFLRPRTPAAGQPAAPVPPAPVPPAAAQPEAPETGPAKRPSPRAKSRKASTE
jgi:hypothetical protein